jgi:hypothetical protein
MDERQILAQLLMQGQGQGMGQGNSMPQYLEGRASDANSQGFYDMLQALAAGAMTPGAMAINPGLGAGMAGVAGAKGYSALDNAARYYQNMGGADMWANRFGEGQPAQGLPGTPSGPAWRR